MKSQPAFKAALLAAGGIVIGRQFYVYSYVFLAAAICMTVAASSWLILKKGRISPVISGLIYSALLLSFAFYISVSSLSPAILANFAGFTGTVDETPRGAPAYSVMLNDCRGYDKKWYRIAGDLIVSSSFELNLSVGDRVAIIGKTTPLSSARNPGDYDWKSFYELNGIAGRIFVEGKRDILLVYHDTKFNFLRDVIVPTRDFLRSKISEFMRGDEAELAKAMILGERRGINGEIDEQFVNTGTIHILAVSGLHIGFLTGMLMIMAALLRIPRRMRFFAMAPILILYAFVVGLMPSITRAVIMALVVLFGLFLQRKPQILNSLGFAALVILALNPSQLFTPGFQLSFAAVMSIAFLHQKILAMVHRSYPALEERTLLNSIVSLSLLTVAATLGTVPLTVYYFNRISLVSVIANLCIVPLAGIFATMTFTSIGMSVLSSWLGGIFGAASQLTGFVILKINSLLGSSNFSSMTISDSGWVFAALFYLWLIAVIAFPMASSSSAQNYLRKKIIFAILLGANFVLYGGFMGHRKSDTKLYVLDVGQGDAIYVELPDGKNMLVDAGFKFRNYDVGERIVVPFLQRHGVRELNYFVTTHLHSDHIGGAASIIEKFKIDSFIYPDQSSNSQVWLNTMAHVKAFKIPARIASAGMILDSSPTCRVYVLHPNPKYVGEGGLAFKTRLNDGSIVLKVCIGGKSFLLAGDAEKRVEHDLVKIYGPFLSSDVYKAGHHGSNTSSSAEFLQTVHPAYAAISVGMNNKFGHPSPEVIEEMKRENIKIWRTDSMGGAFFDVTPDTVRLVQWR
ncbi:MAG TPA: DNA internalization-related competence protein ComEC/Rec2 [Candidatus Acidoferrales bacterium]|nr:DNA internalization-related competence protein ComEC/Rec2 [Candidatus Acidoferrales bacterium]